MRSTPFVMRACRVRPHATAADPPDPRLPVRYAAPSPAQVIRRITRNGSLDARLLPTDRHLQRWAVGQGTGLENTERALIPVSHLTPLDDEQAVLTDQVILSAPEHWRRFIHRWYRSDCSVDQLGQEFGLGRDKLYFERRLVLAYLLGRLEAIGIHLSTFEPIA